jgi:alcohol dehydrogenase
MVRSRSEGGARLAEHVHDGSFAELMRAPTENVYPLPAAAGDDPARWAALGVHVIPCGGLSVGALARR